MQRRALLGGAAGIATLALSRKPASAAARVLKFSHTDTEQGARQQTALLFAKKVAEYSNGSLNVQVFPSGQLANDAKSLEQLKIGGIDFAVTGTGSFGPHLPALDLLILPYLVDSFEQGWKFYDTAPWIKEQFAKLPAKGMRILSTWEAGFRDFTTTTALPDIPSMKGLKVRTYPNKMQLWILQSFGMNPIVMPVTGVYLAIQQGTVVGQENPIDTIYSQRFYEVAPYITLSRHVYSPIPMAISEITWQSLGETDRRAVSKAAVEAGAFIRQTVKANVENLLKLMESKGAKVFDPPSLEPYREAQKPTYDHARETYGAQEVDKILSDAKAIKA
jgi:tripartite ATP-independent transporter DctP family solute receptor